MFWSDKIALNNSFLNQSKYHAIHFALLGSWKQEFHIKECNYSFSLIWKTTHRKLLLLNMSFFHTDTTVLDPVHLCRPILYQSYLTSTAGLVLMLRLIYSLHTCLHKSYKMCNWKVMLWMAMNEVTMNFEIKYYTLWKGNGIPEEGI